MATTAAPPGTFAPGTKVQVGGHRVVIQKYLSEGGFAHVYVVNYPSPPDKHKHDHENKHNNTETAVLKRVAVPDKDALANMRTEVETMKKLKGHKHIVTYIDSHASQLKHGGYEVFLLMEWCQGGGLIEFMNTRLKNRLTEPEILQIFGDTAEGLACMHYLKPPLLHRDLKIENILISMDGGGERLYKLCDFGSSAPPRPAASSAAEGKLIEDDVQRHTTMQYRSPEMIDVYRNRPIDEKSDIWALGVMLYKLCYYITPFEEKGQMAILTASYKYPAYPIFSDRLKLLIAKMLNEEPRRRPNIYQVLSEVCSMRGKPVPINDIYATRTASEARNAQKLPQRRVDVESPPVLGASIVIPNKETSKLPDIAPMRRGRPTVSASSGTSPGKSISKDPFAALDSTNFTTRSKAVDELAGKFPALEDFSLLQNPASSNFKFASAASSIPKAPVNNRVNNRVTNALADEAFGSLRIAVTPADEDRLGDASKHPPVRPARQVVKQPADISRLTDKLPTGMVSTGTSTDDLPPPKPPRPATLLKPDIKPIWRVPAKSPRLSDFGPSDDLRDASPSHQDIRSNEEEPPQSPSSSRPSLEGLRPSSLIVRDTPARSHSASSRHEHTQSRSQQLHGRGRAEPSEDAPLEDNVEYLRAVEEQDHRVHRRSSSKIKQHFKNASISSVPKGLFSGRGRLSDTLKRFEGAKSPSAEASLTRESYMDMPPETTGSSDQEEALEIVEDISPEMRRELERRRLSQEERRVAEAAAAYRRQVNGGGPSGGGARASAIQDRVRSLLDESGRQAPAKRTATGYGQYTAASASSDEAPLVLQQSQTASRVSPAVAMTPVAMKPDFHTTRAPTTATTTAAATTQGLPTRSKTIAEGSGVAARAGGLVRPNAPPKPVALRTGGVISAPQLVENVGGEDNWEESFAKRYPRISLDRLEADAVQSASRRNQPMRVRDV